jgi:hypothetical protein
MNGKTMKNEEYVKYRDTKIVEKLKCISRIYLKKLRWRHEPREREKRSHYCGDCHDTFAITVLQIPSPCFLQRHVAIKQEYSTVIPLLRSLQFSRKLHWNFSMCDFEVL